MITSKEKIEQFKRECRSFNYYLKTLVECNEHIEILDAKLQGVSSPQGNTNEKTSGSGTHPSIIELFMEQDEWKRKKLIACIHIDAVNATLDKIKDPNEKEMIVNMYINNQSYTLLAKKYYYSDKWKLMRKANTILRKII